MEDDLTMPVHRLCLWNLVETFPDCDRSQLNGLSTRLLALLAQSGLWVVASEKVRGE